MLRGRFSMERASFQARLVRNAAWAFGRRLVRGAHHPRWTVPYELMMAVMRESMQRDHKGSAQLMRRQTGKVPERVARKMTLRHELLAGIRAEVHTPLTYRAGDPTVLFLHGGGYVTCSPATHRELIARLALGAGARVWALDYRLAPEHPFPAALDDALAAYGALLAAGVSTETLFIAGDSAGGGLALATLLALRERALPLPRAALLISPWVDLSLDREALQGLGPLDYLNAQMLVETAPQYAGSDLKNPLVSPCYADLHGLPPMLIQSGAWELFCDQNERFVAKARAAGVSVRHEIEPGMLHVYPAFYALLPEARRAVRSLAAYVRSFAPAAATRPVDPPRAQEFR